VRPTAYRRNARGPRDRQAFERIRLQAGELFAAGRSQAEVAGELGVARQNVSRWHALWQAGGLQALRSAGPTGPGPRLSDQRLAAIDQYVGSQSGATFLTVLSLRVFMPPLFDAVSYGCGLVRLPFHWFALATALGEVPKVASFTYLGAAAGDAPTWLKAWIILVPIVGLLGLRLVRRTLRDRRPALPTD